MAHANSRRRPGFSLRSVHLEYVVSPANFVSQNAPLLSSVIGAGTMQQFTVYVQGTQSRLTLGII
jgi:hypothetical protein